MNKIYSLKNVKQVHQQEISNSKGQWSDEWSWIGRLILKVRMANYLTYSWDIIIQALPLQLGVDYTSASLSKEHQNEALIWFVLLFSGCKRWSKLDTKHIAAWFHQYAFITIQFLRSFCMLAMSFVTAIYRKLILLLFSTWKNCGLQRTRTSTSIEHQLCVYFDRFLLR